MQPDRVNWTKQQRPYSYSEFYLWGEPIKGDDAVYSDRLEQWSRQPGSHTGGWNRGWAAVGRKRFDQITPKEAAKFMTAYLGRPVKVTAMAEGCNASSGYPYWIMWFHETK